MVLGGSKKLELTWHAARNKWKKKYKGKLYYAPTPNMGKTDGDGYKAALSWWEGKKTQLDRIAPENERKEGYGVFGDLTEEEEHKIIMGEAERDRWKASVGRREDGEPVLSFEDWREQKKALEYASEMKAKEASTQPVAKTETVKAFVDTFLAFKLSQAQGGQRSLGRYIQLRSKLNHFSESIGEEKEAISVSWGVALASYYTALLSDIAAEKIGEDTARDKMQVAKQFIKRLYEIGLIDRPRNLDSKDMAISGGAKKIKIPALEKLKEVIDVAPDIYNDFYAIKAWLLLMANCGFTQQDVSDLKQEEVDWKSGTITRKRSKKERKNEEQIPTVCYKLWKETLDALKPYRKSKKTTVFANRDGNPLVRATISESGKGSITDTIAKTYAAWLEDAAETNTKLKSAPSLKRFRKASSNQLKKSRDYRHFFDYFLGHAPKTVGERSYGEEYQPEFDKAVGWIRTEYGYED